MDADHPKSPAAPPPFVARLGECAPAVGAALARLRERDVLGRIARRDHTVWSPDPHGIADRLGWLDIAARMPAELPRLHALRRGARADGFRRALLVGMGGSSLAPDVLRRTFGTAPDGLALEVLDSTHPDTVRAALARHNPTTTLIIVATKSGTTIETLSLFKAAHARAAAALGSETGMACVAITDPGSALESLGREQGFRAILHGETDIGGRFSALSHFGMAPGAIIGADVDSLVERAVEAGARAADADGVAARLGAVLAGCAADGRDKLTLVADPAVDGLCDWIEQLVAESTGKAGRGIVPVVGEALGEPEGYAPDRLFVRVAVGDGDTASRERERLDALAAAGHPVVELGLDGALDLGAQFVIWELAVATAGHLLGVQPFDQPNVEATKVRARELVTAFRSTGELPDADARRPEPGVLRDFFADLAPGPGAYIAIQAFLHPTPAAGDALERLRERLRAFHRVAVTLGYGPRYLHSTGQLHKGDAGLGRFLQLTADPSSDVPIPDAVGATASSLGFATLLRAQALGDAAALRDAGRRVLRIHLGSEADVPEAIDRLIANG